MEVRAIALADRPWVSKVIADHFASPRIVSRGILHDCQALPGLVVVRDNAPCGVLLYDIREAECEVIALVSLVRRTGAAAALLDAVEDDRPRRVENLLVAVGVRSCRPQRRQEPADEERPSPCCRRG